LKILTCQVVSKQMVHEDILHVKTA